MAESLIKIYRLKTTFDEFQSWVRNYKLVYEKDDSHVQFNNRYQRDGLICFEYPIRRDDALGQTQGQILFFCRPLELALLHVTTTVVSRQGIDEAELDRLIEIYHDFLDALQHKFEPAVPVAPAGDAPPWDKLRTRERWEREDWKYFFDSLRGFIITPEWPFKPPAPDFEKMAALTARFCDHPKTPGTIKDAYHGLYRVKTKRTRNGKRKTN